MSSKKKKDEVLSEDEVSKGEFLDKLPDEEVAPPLDETPEPVEDRIVAQGILDHMPTPKEVEAGVILNCEVCQNTGAVPRVVVDGKTTEWKDCPKCGGHPVDPRTGLRFNPTGLRNVG